MADICLPLRPRGKLQSTWRRGALGMGAWMGNSNDPSGGTPSFAWTDNPPIGLNKDIARYKGGFAFLNSNAVQSGDTPIGKWTDVPNGRKWVSHSFQGMQVGNLPSNPNDLKNAGGIASFDLPVLDKRASFARHSFEGFVQSVLPASVFPPLACVNPFYTDLPPKGIVKTDYQWSWWPQELPPGESIGKWFYENPVLGKNKHSFQGSQLAPLPIPKVQDLFIYVEQESYIAANWKYLKSRYDYSGIQLSPLADNPAFTVGANTQSFDLPTMGRNTKSMVSRNIYDGAQGSPISSDVAPGAGVSTRLPLTGVGG